MRAFSRRIEVEMYVLNLVMAGIDSSLAGIDTREQFSLTETRRRDAYNCLREDKSLRGAVIIATCNRTELYLSLEDGAARDPFQLLCQALSLGPGACLAPHRILRGEAVFWHLAQLACGAKSQIWGEDQIITQVKASVAAARECRAADNVLEVLFRTAVTAAKKIKTLVPFSRNAGSAAEQAVQLIQRRLGSPARVLVIGNGEIGRLTAGYLARLQYETWMTLRRFRHGQAQAVEGVFAIDYAQRYEQMHAFNAVVSATLSPHYTVELAPFAALSHKPELMIDLAVPRDIDPATGRLEGVAYYDVDTLAGPQLRADHAKTFALMEPILQKYQDDFFRWARYQASNSDRGAF